MTTNIRRRSAGWLGACLLVTPVVASVAQSTGAQAADPTWGISWALNPSNDVDELSRTFDRDEDGVIDLSANPAEALPQILNPDQFSLHVRACSTPPGYESVEWTLARPDQAPLPAVTTAECETDLVLPDKPFPEAREYTLTATVHYPEPAADQVREAAVHVQDVFMIGLGDSYGSGEGNPLQVDEWFGSQESTWDNKRCHRSRLSGQEIAAQELDQHPGVNVTFLHLACSGALASEGILQPYMGIEPRSGSIPPLPPQIDQAREYVDYSLSATGEKRYPDVIVTSVGGNDAGFADVVTNCVKYPDWIAVPIPVFPFVVPVDLDSCFEDDEPGATTFPEGLAKLEGLYGEIDQAVDGTLCTPASPCDFLITEYPDGATDEDGETCSVNPGFSEEEFQWVIDSMVPRLNNEILKATEANGWKYVGGVRDNFYKHGICAEDNYLRDILESHDVQSGIDGAFHPNTSGHMFGYAPAIGSALRSVLGFPYPFLGWPAPMYFVDDDTPVCDSKLGDGNHEHTVVAPATDPNGLDLPSDIAYELANGMLPDGLASANSCPVYAHPRLEPAETPQELAAGSSGCSSDARPCVGSNAAGALLRLPVFGDEAPLIEAQAAADVDGGSDDDLPTERHRRSSGGADGTTAFYAAPAGSAGTVSGEIVVDLTAYTQSGGARASSRTDFELEVESVTHPVGPCEDDGEWCPPSTRTQIAGIDLALVRNTCVADSESSHNCGQGEFYNGRRSDEVEMYARAGGEAIVSIDRQDEYPHAPGAAGSAVAVRGGLAAPQRQVRLPYSVPAGSVVLVTVHANTYEGIGEECGWDWTNFPCSAQGRISSRIGFAPDGATGVLVPLAGFTAPDTGDTGDTVPPSITATLDGTMGNDGWYVGDVDVDIAAADEADGSGVQSISYTVDGGAAQVATDSTANVTVTGDGEHEVSYSAVDASGNTSPTGTATFKIDTTKPTISISPSDGTSYAKGANVTTDLSCTDATSGVVACTGPATLDTNTPGSHTATFTAGDAAGNTITRTLAYSVLAPPLPPPPPAVKDLVNIRIPQMGYSVDGAVTSGGFEMTRTANGQMTSVSGTATFTRPNGNTLTVTILAVRVAGFWIGAINVNDPGARLNISAATLSRAGVTTVGTNGATGQFTTAGSPSRTINWTVTDLD